MWFQGEAGIIEIAQTRDCKNQKQAETRMQEEEESDEKEKLREWENVKFGLRGSPLVFIREQAPESRCQPSVTRESK